MRQHGSLKNSNLGLKKPLLHVIKLWHYLEYVFNAPAFSIHYAKSVRIRSYSGPHFSRIFPHLDWIWRDTEYLPVFGPNAEKCGKNADQNNSEYGHMNCQILYLKTNSITLVFYDLLIQKSNCGITAVVFKGCLPFFPELIGEIEQRQNPWACKLRQN